MPSCRSWSRAATLAGVVALPACRRNTTPVNVLVVTLDTLRADRAGAYEAEAAANPKNYGAQFNLARLLLKDGRLPAATARLRAAVDARPEFAEGYLYLAKALLDAGQLQEAAPAASQGLSKSPDRGIAPLGHDVLADVYSRQGRENEAAREVARARALERGR